MNPAPVRSEAVELKVQVRPRGQATTSRAPRPTAERYPLAFTYAPGAADELRKMEVARAVAARVIDENEVSGAGSLSPGYEESRTGREDVCPRWYCLISSTVRHRAPSWSTFGRTKR